MFVHEWLTLNFDSGIFGTYFMIFTEFQGSSLEIHIEGQEETVDHYG